MATCSVLFGMKGMSILIIIYRNVVNQSGYLDDFNDRTLECFDVTILSDYSQFQDQQKYTTRLDEKKIYRYLFLKLLFLSLLVSNL